MNKIQVFCIFLLNFPALLFSEMLENQQANCNEQQTQQSTISLSFAFFAAVGDAGRNHAIRHIFVDIFSCRAICIIVSW